MSDSMRSLFNITIFYNSLSWNVLINHLFTNIIKLDNHCRYYIYLSSFRGEHIKLIVPNYTYTLKDKHKIDSELKTFLIINPSQESKQKLPFNRLFMNFPNNTVFSNLEIKNSVITQKFEPLHSFISKTIVNVLSQDKIDADTIFTFSTYLFLGLFKVHNEINPSLNINDFLQPYSEISIVENYALSSEEFADLFENNSPNLFEIYEDVFTSSISTGLSWVREWKTLCLRLINPDFINSDLRSIIDIIIDHLGISAQQKLLTLRLINEVLNTTVIKQNQ